MCGHVKAEICNVIQSVIHSNMAGTQTGEVGTPLVPIT
jgi:hypothetical protein